MILTNIYSSSKHALRTLLRMITMALGIEPGEDASFKRQTEPRSKKINNTSGTLGRCLGVEAGSFSCLLAAGCFALLLQAYILQMSVMLRFESKTIYYQLVRSATKWKPAKCEVFKKKTILQWHRPRQTSTIYWYTVGINIQHISENITSICYCLGYHHWKQ